MITKFVKPFEKFIRNKIITTVWKWTNFGLMLEIKRIKFG
jgi:hypothetical protein